MPSRILGDHHAHRAGDAPVLYCFHHAGGSAASFAGWRRSWRGGVLRLVELAGRPGSGTAGARDLDDLLQGLLPAFLQEPRARVRYGFYGHSLGALVAYRLAQAIAQRGDEPPAFLAVSGRRSPACPLLQRALWSLDDASLVAQLRLLGGVPEAILASPKWLGVLLPALRADLRLSDEYRHPGGPALRLPIIALRGRDDPIVSREEIGNWRHAGCAQFEQVELPGAHFLDTAGQAMLQQRLQRALLDWATPDGRAPA